VKDTLLHIGIRLYLYVKGSLKLLRCKLFLLQVLHLNSLFIFIFLALDQFWN